MPGRVVALLFASPGPVERLGLVLFVDRFRSTRPVNEKGRKPAGGEGFLHPRSNAQGSSAAEPMRPAPTPLYGVAIERSAEPRQTKSPLRQEEWAEAHSSVPLPSNSRSAHHPTFMVCQAVCWVSASLNALPSASEFTH